MIYKFFINGNDVTSYVISSFCSKTYSINIDECSLELSSKIKDLLTLNLSDTIECYRGFDSYDESRYFIGTITKIKPSDARIALTCKSRLYDTIKNGRTKSWEKDIDIEAGIGSEIVKSILDHNSLNYTPAKGTYTNGSIHFTGSDDSLKIVKFVQKDEDDYQKLMDLALNYNYISREDHQNDLIIFQPKNFEEYSVPLTVGIEIPNPIVWEENMEQLCNKVKVMGATVQDTRISEFTGPDTSFTLPYIPEETEVRINSTTTNDLQVRGQKGMGVFGTDFDYYIKKDSKNIVFNSNVSNVWVKYGTKVPMPLIATNETSINTYGGPNKIPHYKKIDYNDIKDLDDATLRAKAYLNKYSKPFISAEDISVKNSVQKEYGFLEPGLLIHIIDPNNNKDLTVLIKELKIEYPKGLDTISVGDEIWRSEVFQAYQIQKINQLFSELYKNESFLYQIIDFTTEIKYERRYQALSDGSGNTLNLIQGNKTYKELFYDLDFFDESNSSSDCAVNTTERQLVLPVDAYFVTKSIEKNTNRNFLTLDSNVYRNPILVSNIGYIPTSGKSFNSTTQQKFSQAFELDYNSIIDYISIYFYTTETGTPEVLHLNFEIYEADSIGQPTGDVIYKKYYTFTHKEFEDEEPKLFYLPNTLRFLKDTLYCFVLSCEQNSTNKIFVKLNSDKYTPITSPFSIYDNTVPEWNTYGTTTSIVFQIVGEELDRTVPNLKYEIVGNYSAVDTEWKTIIPGQRFKFSEPANDIRLKITNLGD